jgi:alkylation response protein AidB-like acyl-CoA dehydrogenase
MAYDYTRSLYSEEHEIFRDSVRRFIATELEPHVDEWDEKQLIPKSFWLKAGAAGLLAVTVPEKYGGPGGNFLHRVIVTQELGYSFAGASMSPAFEADQISEQIMDYGSEEQKLKWLPKMATGEVRFGFAMTEPDSGTDVSAMRTKAVRDGNDYVINGAKTYISGINSVQVMLLACRTSADPGTKGLSVIMVETDRPGFRRGRQLKKMGSHAADNGELFLESVRVPVSNIFGTEGNGFKLLMGALNRDRLMWSLIAHAAATRAFDETVEFVKNRKGFGQRIFDFQNTQFKLAEMKTELAVGRSFLDDCLRYYLEHGKFDPVKSSMAKMWLPEMEGRVIDQAVQLHGGAGYMDEYHVSRLYTAARLHRIFAGTAEVMRINVARSI